MIDNNEIQRLATMGSALRPDWPARSLATFLSKHFADRAYGDVAVALAWVCTRTKTETPRLLLESGPWWKATVVEGGTLAPRPPKRDEACATCGRRDIDHNGPIAGDHSFTPLDQATRGRIAVEGAAAVRETLTAAKAKLCRHGVDRSIVRCGDCDRPAPQPAPHDETTDTENTQPDAAAVGANKETR